MENIRKAAELAVWLIETQHKTRVVSVIISCNKFKIPFSKRSEVSKQLTQIIKHPKEQMELL